ncbi:MAG TPA: hypothetical protein VGM29_03900, partial [Polyangiaceae bacterium]
MPIAVPRAAMADDPANEDAPEASNDDAVQDEPRRAPVARTEPPLPEWAPPAARGSSSLRRGLLLGAAFLLPSAAIAVSLFVILKGGAPRELAPIASSVVNALGDAGPATSAAAGADEGVPALEKAAPAGIAFEDEGSDQEPSEPSPAKKEKPKHFATVQEAAAGSCSTESVDGLSRQIIEQARCIKPNDFVALPKRPNLVMAAHVYPYLELGTRDHLLKALDAHASATMTINSALRTVAQQYLVSHWAASKICGVQLATPPGESNHEIGTALDIAEASKWRPALEAQEFRWLGTSDRVHFDYKGGSASAPKSATDVLAFQKLWNRNHKDDAITENGQYSSATEQRLKKAPPGG